MRRAGGCHSPVEAVTRTVHAHELRLERLSMTLNIFGRNGLTGDAGLGVVHSVHDEHKVDMGKLFTELHAEVATMPGERVLTSVKNLACFQGRSLLVGGAQHICCDEVNALLAFGERYPRLHLKVREMLLPQTVQPAVSWVEVQMACCSKFGEDVFLVPEQAWRDEDSVALVGRVHLLALRVFDSVVHHRRHLLSSQQLDVVHEGDEVILQNISGGVRCELHCRGRLKRKVLCSNDGFIFIFVIRERKTKLNVLPNQREVTLIHSDQRSVCFTADEASAEPAWK